MGTFNSKAKLKADHSLIPEIAEHICDVFELEGYNVKSEESLSGGYDISITKGNIFKAVLGMKTALKVTLVPTDGGINFEAGVGIWGQQAIPTVIMYFFYWPVIITQIWGMVEQAKLDDKALAAAREIIAAKAPVAPQPIYIVPEDAKPAAFCTNCGGKVPAGSHFCPNCGSAL